MKKSNFFHQVLSKPHIIFWSCIPLILLLGALYANATLYTNATLDINIHDTYFVIAYIHLTIIVLILFGLLGLGYWVMQGKLQKWLSASHILLSFGGFLVLFVANLIEPPYNPQSLDLLRTIYSLKLLAVLGIAAGQLLFVLNIVIGVCRKIT